MLNSCIKFKLNHKLCNFISVHLSLHTHNTLFKHNIIWKKRRLKHTSVSVVCRGSQFWNELDDTLKTSRHISTCKENICYQCTDQLGVWGRHNGVPSLVYVAMCRCFPVMILLCLACLYYRVLPFNLLISWLASSYLFLSPLTLISSIYILFHNKSCTEYWECLFVCSVLSCSV